MESRPDSCSPVEGESRPPLRIFAAVAGFGVLAAIVFMTFFREEPDKAISIESLFADDAGSVPSAQPVDGYIGSRSCRGCHENEHLTWSASYHSKMTQVASPESILGNFDQVVLETQGEHFRLDRDGDGYWVEMHGEGLREAGPDARAAFRRKIVLTTGSHHMQVYWFSSGNGNELVALPFIWLVKEEKWIPRLSAFLNPPLRRLVPERQGALEVLFEKGRWNNSCIHCHTTHGKPLTDPFPRTTVSEFGISCESCHGPGKDHVEWHRPGAIADGADPMKSPRDLTHPRSSQVCGQCHSIHRASTWEQYSEIDRSGKPFRPGDCLDTLYDFETDATNPGYRWSDGMVRVTGREYSALQDSPCFIQKDASCFSCHEMHAGEGASAEMLADWAEDQLKPRMRGNEACVQCHEAYRDEKVLVNHTRHSPISSGSDCMNCHMPNTVYGLLKATRSHQVSNPSIAETLEVGRPNACNLCHLDKSLNWTGNHLAEWYGQEPPEGSDTGDVAHSAVMALRGDAAERALVAWHMGWEPARSISGESWMPPYLAKLMEDDYDAVRFIAGQSFGKLSGYDDIKYDFNASGRNRAQTVGRIRARWRESGHRDEDGLLIRDGRMMPLYQHLLDQRNERMINLLE